MRIIILPEDALAGITALDASVEVVPMVQQTYFVERCLMFVLIGLFCICFYQCLTILHGQHTVGTIEQSDVVVCTDCGVTLFVSLQVKALIVRQRLVDA